jgi:hypothetical protein
MEVESAREKKEKARYKQRESSGEVHCEEPVTEPPLLEAFPGPRNSESLSSLKIFAVSPEFTQAKRYL